MKYFLNKNISIAKLSFISILDLKVNHYFANQGVQIRQVFTPSSLYSNGLKIHSFQWVKILLFFCCCAAIIFTNVNLFAEIPTRPSVESIAPNENGVDIMSSNAFFSIPTVSIGNGAGALNHQLQTWTLSSIRGVSATTWSAAPNSGVFFKDVFHIGVQSTYEPSEGPCKVTMSVGLSAEKFCQNDDYTSFSPNKRSGSSLIKLNSTTYIYTTAEGVVYTLGTENKLPKVTGGVNGAAVRRIDWPDGRRADFYYHDNRRIQSIVFNNGLQLKYEYQANTFEITGFYRITKVTAINGAVEYCNPAALSCTLSNTWPSAIYKWPITMIPPSLRTDAPVFSTVETFTLTDQANRVSTFVRDTYGDYTKYKPATSTTNYIQYNLCNDRRSNCLDCTGTVCRDRSHGKLKTVNNNGQIWEYWKSKTFYEDGNLRGFSYGERSPKGDSRDRRAWGWINEVDNALTYYTEAYIDWLIDGNGNKHYFTPTVAGRGGGILTNIEYAGGDMVFYGYDLRGNLSRKTLVAKTGSGLSNIVTTAGFDTTCTYRAKCNQPNYIIDPKGNRTDFEYDNTHGGVTKVTSPAVNGIRSQMRYFYTQKYAYSKNSSGAYVQATTPIWLLTSERTCNKGAASGNGCAVAGDEVVTTYDYGPNSGPNNLWLRGTTVTADGQTLRTCYGYDKYGHKISETTPKAGLSSCP